MSRVFVDYHLRLLELAFREPPSADGDTTSFLGNLENTPPGSWDWLPPGGRRTIRAIAIHVGGALYTYHDAAFGTGALTFDAVLRAASTQTDPADVIAWATRAYDLMRESVTALDDDSLLAPRGTPWNGEPRETALLVTSMAQHLIYHAGEINHIRALFMSNDGWAWEPR